MLLPGAALGWILVQGLGSDVALVAVGLYGLLFAFLGRGDRESPYRILAVSGFVGFVAITFWSKLELRVAQAYVIPAGVGVLALLQMFRAQVAPELVGKVRLATLLAMIGSSAWYALLDERYPVGFHLTLLFLCLFAMGVGSFLRVRLYLVLGFAGVVLSLGSIFYHAVALLDRSARMSAVGLLVLLVGAALVGGAIYYKANRERMNARVDALRARLGEWE